MILELETGSSDDNLQIYYKVLTLEATKLTVFQAFEVGQEPKSKRCWSADAIYYQGHKHWVKSTHFVETSLCNSVAK